MEQANHFMIDMLDLGCSRWTGTEVDIPVVNSVKNKETGWRN